MIPCVSFTELFPDHHAPTSHYQTMIAGKHRIEHSKLTIFHITPPLPYSLLLPTPFPLRHFPFHFYSASLPSLRHSPFFFHSESPLSLSLHHSLVSQLLPFLFATSPLSCLLSYYFLSYSVTSLLFCLFPFHNGTVFRIFLPLRNRKAEAIPSTEPVAEASQRNPSHNGTVSRISLPLWKRRRRKEDKCEQNIC